MLTLIRVTRETKGQRGDTSVGGEPGGHVLSRIIVARCAKGIPEAARRIGHFLQAEQLSSAGGVIGVRGHTYEGWSHYRSISARNCIGIPRSIRRPYRLAGACE